MSSTCTDGPESFGALLADARAGSPEALGRLLSQCRDYLLMVANRACDPTLRGKVSPSDLVQETFLNAHQQFARFEGSREDEFLAWLSCILNNQAANTARRFRAAAKRNVLREVSLDALDSEGAGELPADLSTPSKQAAAREQTDAVVAALARLPEHYRRVVELRNREHLDFAAIGQALNCSAEAARKLWARALDQLQRELDQPHEP